MATFGSILSIARSAMVAHQTAIQVTSQNISNAETPGYSRQRAMLAPGYPQRTPQGMLGTGVFVQDIEQIRNTLLDVSFRRDSSQAAGFGLRRDLLERVEGVFGEPSENGLSATLDAFWASWGDLANAPTSNTARGVVRERGTQVAAMLNRFAQQLHDQQQGTHAQLTDSLAELNGLARQVAELNVQITAAEAGGQTASDLRDARNIAVDSMSRLANVRVLEQRGGGIAVLVANQTLVDGSAAKQIVTSGVPPAGTLHFAGDADALPDVGGELGAMMQFLNEDLPDATAKLDQLARAVAEQVNQLHRSGWSPAGDGDGAANWDPAAPPTGSNIDFFAVPVDSVTGLPDPSRITAASIGLSAQVRSNEQYVAAGNVQNATGNNAIAIAMAALRTNTGSVTPDPAAPGTTQSFADFYRDLVVGVALESKSAETSASVHRVIAQQSDARRQSVSGVSTDEELIALMRHQQAYVAATRLVNVADEMAQSLLNMV